MGIGAISAFQPYVYNTNTLSAKSLSPIAGIGSDIEKSHTSRVSEKDLLQENINPLRPGESADFAEILEMQFQMGMNQADHFFGSDSVFAG